jgi:hypothetical protein
MPIYDFYCEECGCEDLDVFCKVTDGMICTTCMKPMKKKCNCHSFKLIFNNKTQLCGWAADGYSHNAYWDEVKKQRSEGKNVKGLGED